MKAARNKRPRLRSGSSGMARLPLGIFLTANIPTSMPEERLPQQLQSA
jgi:hypothetical protein